MAIKKNMDREENEVKAAFPNAYIRVNDVLIRTNSGEVHIHVNVFADADARNDQGAISILKATEKTTLPVLKPFLADLSENGLKAAAYLYLKTLPRYQGIDC